MPLSQYWKNAEFHEVNESDIWILLKSSKSRSDKLKVKQRKSVRIMIQWVHQRRVF